MIIETKYDIGDVIKYQKIGKKEIIVTCPFCKGDGKATDEKGKTHRCQCELGILTYYEPSEPIIVTGEIELIDFRNFGCHGSSQVVMYRCKEDKKRKSKISGPFDNWVDENDIIEKIEKAPALSENLGFVALLEFESLMQRIKDNDMSEREKFCDHWDYEDEYSHNEIDENMPQFLNTANKYFEDNNLPYKARYGVDNVLVEKIQ